MVFFKNGNDFPDKQTRERNRYKEQPLSGRQTQKGFVQSIIFIKPPMSACNGHIPQYKRDEGHKNSYQRKPPFSNIADPLIETEHNRSQDNNKIKDQIFVFHTREMVCKRSFMISYS